MNILPYFQDFDRRNSGTVTLNQFFSVLGNNGLTVFGDKGEEIFKEFIVQRNRKCIDYLAFHRTLLHYAKDGERELFKF
jgi:Ca2+-binding EF-hand superfamily protein